MAGIIDMGLVSPGSLGVFPLGMGVTMACFHAGPPGRRPTMTSDDATPRRPAATSSLPAEDSAAPGGPLGGGGAQAGRMGGLPGGAAQPIRPRGGWAELNAQPGHLTATSVVDRRRPSCATMRKR